MSTLLLKRVYKDIVNEKIILLERVRVLLQEFLQSTKSNEDGAYLFI